MHSHYSSGNQPYEYYNYTIFRGRGGQHVQRTAFEPPLDEDGRRRTASGLIWSTERSTPSVARSSARQCSLSSRRSSHELAEAGEALTLDRFRSVYRELLDAYFGPDFVIDKQLELECLAHPALLQCVLRVQVRNRPVGGDCSDRERVVNGGREELGDYLSFLKGGCSKYPLELLRDAGVDMESPEPVATALDYFERLVDELDELL